MIGIVTTYHINFRKKLIYFFPFLIAGFIISSCGQNIPQEKKPISLIGHYLNRTFLDKVSDSLPGTIPVYCYELNFFYKDSVDINFGFETARFGTSKNGDTVIIKNACAKGDLSIIMNPDSSIVLVDSSWTGLKTNSVFKKSDLLTKDEWHFDLSLNEKLIAGKYSIDVPPTSSQISFVEFEDWGKVNGLDQFISYKICYSGDCVGLTTPLSNTIDFIDIKGNTKSFAFTISKTPNRHIDIFNLGDSNPDIKGEIPIKERYLGLTEMRPTKN